jgi:hypothetical protein
MVRGLPRTLPAPAGAVKRPFGANPKPTPHPRTPQSLRVSFPIRVERETGLEPATSRSEGTFTNPNPDSRETSV